MWTLIIFTFFTNASGAVATPVVTTIPFEIDCTQAAKDATIGGQISSGAIQYRGIAVCVKSKGPRPGEAEAPTP